jgi:hypothetical protein
MLLLVLMLFGLIGYSLWGFVRALLDPLKRGTSPKGLAQRAGYLVSAFTYGALVIPTFRFLRGLGREEGNGPQDVTAWFLAQPFGPWLVGLGGIIAMIGGIGQFYQGVTTDFKKDLKFRQMSEREQNAAIRTGRFGMAARGVVFAILGFFLVQAGLHKDATEAKGLDGALQLLAQQTAGAWLLGIVALGLVAFGMFSLLSARWIRITPQEQVGKE